MHETLIDDVKMSLDGINDQGDHASILGWCFSSSKPIENMRVRQDEVYYEASYGEQRPDVAEHYKTIIATTQEDIPKVEELRSSFANSGFTINLSQKFEGGSDIVLEVLRENEWSKVAEMSEFKKALTKPVSPIEALEVLKISESLMPSLIVIDNVYKNPHKVREFALSCDFEGNSSYHKGNRTNTRYITEEHKSLFGKALGKQVTAWEEHGMNGVFQYCIAEDLLVYHTDQQSYAAMIFLTPDAPPSCGTTLYKSRSTGLRGSPTEKDSERLGRSTGELHYDIFKNNFYDKTDLEVVDVAGNVFNRLIIFDAQSIHAASEYFGNDKENSRLFQIFFFDAE